LPPSAQSYVVRAADLELLESLRRGDFCYVLTPRQTGKSSLMARVAATLTQEGYAVLILDLTRLGRPGTAEQWYAGQVYQMVDGLRLESEVERHFASLETLSALDRWQRTIREVLLDHERHIIVFIDEVDFVRSLPFPTDEFFAALRQFYNGRAYDPALMRLTFCLLGVARPSDLIQVESATPFNIGRRIEVNDFTIQEAGPLVCGLTADQRRAEAVLQRVFHWTDGHPYLTQLLCERLQGAQFPRDVDTVCDREFFAGRTHENDHLHFVSEYLTRSADDRQGMLSRYSEVLRGKGTHRRDSDPLFERLWMSGIVKEKDGRLVVRNNIYRKVFDLNWVRDNLTGEEERRHRKALNLRLWRLVLLIAALTATFLAGRYLR
jgi:hypothetical protein